MTWKSRSFIILLVLLLLLFLSSMGLLYKSIQFHSVTFSDAFQKITRHTIRPEKRPMIRVLAIDGGGTHGIIPLKILAYLEKQTHRPISDLFDVIVGTSSGAISAIFLTLPNDQEKPLYTAQFLVDNYFKYCQKIFSPSLKHRLKTGFGLLGPAFDVSLLHQQLASYFNNKTFHQLLSPVIIPAYDLRQENIRLFRSYEKKYDYELSTLATGASAAPPFFAPVDLSSTNHQAFFTLLDGSTFLNTPVLQAYYEAIRLHPNSQYIIVSLGTGELGILQPMSVSQFKKMGWFEWIPNLFLIFFDANQELIRAQIEFMYTFLKHSILAYIRYDFQLPSPHRSIFDTSEKNAHALIQLTDQFIAQNKQSLDFLAHLLVKCKESTCSSAELRQLSNMSSLKPMST